MLPYGKAAAHQLKTPRSKLSVADSAEIGRPVAPSGELLYVHRLHSLSGSLARSNSDLTKAYGAYQVLAASQH